MRRRRRHFFLIGISIGLFLGIGITRSVLRSTQLSEVSGVFHALSQARSRLIGGDITAEPPLPIIVPPKIPEKVGTSTPPVIGARAIMVKDHVSGASLYGEHEYIPRPVASITKLMSALVLLERAPFAWQATTTVAVDDIIDTHMYAGDTYSIEELWNAMLVASSNKAVWTLVDALWGDPASPTQGRVAFVNRMNEKARELGMVDSKFVEPTGLDAQNSSSPSDTAILLRAAMMEDDIVRALTTPEYRYVSAERRVTHHVWNTNWLLLGWIPHSFAMVIGGKTGYIPESGYNVAVQVTDTASNTLDVVIFGAETNEGRFTAARDIAQWVFENYRWPE